MRYHRTVRIDANQKEIVDALRSVGVSVQSLALVGDGCPDLLCSYRGVLTLLEVKRLKKRNDLTEKQLKWRAGWDAHSPVHIVETSDEAIDYATRRR